jgi:DNA topoisomerase-2
MAGIEVLGRDRYGVFPLKGKVMNVRECGLTTLAAN